MSVLRYGTLSQFLKEYFLEKTKGVYPKLLRHKEWEKSGFPLYGGIRFDRITIYFLGRIIPWINSATVDLKTGSDSEWTYII